MNSLLTIDAELVAVGVMVFVIWGLLKLGSFIYDRMERQRLVDEEHRMIVKYYADLHQQFKDYQTKLLASEPKDSIGE